MVHAFVTLMLSIVQSSALAEQCASHSPDECFTNMQLPAAQQMIDSDNDRFRASRTWPRRVSMTSCPETIAPVGGRSHFKGYNASAKRRCIANSLNYVKVPKVGSSTMAGVFRRIAARNGIYGVDVYQTCANRYAKKNVTPFQEPVVCANHIERPLLLERFHGKSSYPMLNFAVVRRPLDRALSKLEYMRTPQYTFPVSSNETFELVRGLIEQYGWLADKDPNWEVQRLRREMGGEEFVDAWGWSNDTTPKFLLRTPTDLLNDYEVVGQTKRMAEVALLVAFNLKLNSLADVLYVSAKFSNLSGGRSHSVADLPKYSQDWLHTSMYKQVVKRDKELYKAAGQKMDNQIRVIDEELAHISHSETFAQILGRYKSHLRKAFAQCGRNGQRFPESECYWRDNGCGWRCLDEYSTANAMQLALPVI